MINIKFETGHSITRTTLNTEINVHSNDFSLFFFVKSNKKRLLVAQKFSDVGAI